MWFDGWSLIITAGPGKENIYIDMWPVYLSVATGFLFYKFFCIRKKGKK